MAIKIPIQWGTMSSLANRVGMANSQSEMMRLMQSMTLTPGITQTTNGTDLTYRYTMNAADFNYTTEPIYNTLGGIKTPTTTTPPKETNVAWLDRRVQEMRVRL